MKTSAFSRDVILGWKNGEVAFFVVVVVFVVCFFFGGGGGGLISIMYL